MASSGVIDDTSSAFRSSTTGLSTVNSVRCRGVARRLLN